MGQLNIFPFLFFFLSDGVKASSSITTLICLPSEKKSPRYRSWSREIERGLALTGGLEPTGKEQYWRWVKSDRHGRGRATQIYPRWVDFLVGWWVDPSRVTSLGVQGKTMGWWAWKREMWELKGSVQQERHHFRFTYHEFSNRVS